jgi:hypothetical protein
VVEEDDAVGDVFLQAETGQAFFSLLAGDDSGDSLFLRKPKQRFSSARRIVSLAEAGKEGLNGVKRHPLGTD